MTHRPRRSVVSAARLALPSSLPPFFYYISPSSKRPASPWLAAGGHARGGGGRLRCGRGALAVRRAWESGKAGGRARRAPADDGELRNKNPPTPCLWQAPASTQKAYDDELHNKNPPTPCLTTDFIHSFFAEWRSEQPNARNVLLSRMQGSGVVAQQQTTAITTDNRTAAARTARRTVVEKT